MLVHDISGDFYNVVGLPIARVARAQFKNSRNCIWRWVSPAPTILAYRMHPDRAQGAAENR